MTPSTVATWALNGVQQEFDVTFDYLSRTYVKLTLIGPVPKSLTVGTDFEFVTPTRVRTFVAYGPPEYSLLEVRRETSTTERLVEFHDASILTASDMNVADLQVLHVAEEARNAATETLGVNNDGHLDARGRRIVNGADPVEPQDFATKGYIDGQANGATQARIAAEAARDAAKGHRDAAASSATQSAQSASTAGTHANTAKTHRDAAKVSQDAAKVSQDASKASENASSASAGASQTSADASKASELKAKDWAEKLPGPVEGAQYSAKYWAQQAAAGVIPENSITAMKMPLWNSANVIPDHNFWDLGGAWVAPGAPAESKVVSNSSRGRGLRVDIANNTGTAGAFAWDIRSRRFKVYPGRPINIAALVESGATPLSTGSPTGEVAVLVSWLDEQGQRLAGDDAIVVQYFTPGQQNGDVAAWVTPPSGSVYAYIRVRARYSSAGAWSGFFILYRPQAFMQVPIYQASVSMDSLDGALSAKVNNGQVAFDRYFKDYPNQIQGGNMNNARASGQYLFNGATGSPNGIVSWFFLEEIRADSSSAAQTATLINGVGKYANGCKWFRTMTSGVWGEWLEVTAIPQTTLLYPGGSPASPGVIGTGQRVILGNPYPGWNVIAIPEIYLGGLWGDPNWASNSGTGAQSYGLRVTQMDDGGDKNLVLVSGASAIHGAGPSTGSPFGGGDVIGPLQFRVRVTRISR